MPVEEFTVSVVDTGDDVLIVVTGTLDVATCPKLASTLHSIDREARSDIVVDLAEVTFLDSNALHLLTDVSLELLTYGRRLILSNPSKIVTRLLTITDLQTWFSPRE